MTTLIEGGAVYDGSGGPAREADVLLHGGVVARVAPRLKERAAETINAKGAMVAPGLVDVANYADHYNVLFEEATHTNFLARGITSIVVGQGGVSLPLTRTYAARLAAWWGRGMDTPSRSATMRDFFSLLRRRIGVNVGTLVGHATVREEILGGVSRDLTEGELKRMEAAIAAAVREGALGVSLNLGYPSVARAPRREWHAAASAATRMGGIVAMRLRDRETRLKEHLEEAFMLSEAVGANLLITDLEPFAREDDAYRAILARITRGSADHNLHFATSGTGIAAVPLALFFPEHLREPSWSRMAERLTNPAIREEVRAHLARYRGISFRIGAIADPSLKLLEGTSFSNWSLHEHISFEDALIYLMAVSGLRGVLVGEMGDVSLARAFARHDRVVLASGDAAAPSLGPPTYATLLFEKNNEAFPFEQRVARMAAVPAAKLGLARRGMVREGYRADLVVIADGAVRDVWVNGIRAIEGGVPTGRCGGVALMRT
ncbi:MAG: hypothetical protein HYU81_00060 [Candidatus Brennerbacteria bacterium]|nr:hypothetical protein [Candidatus Brennerbacteria bacterium]